MAFGYIPDKTPWKDSILRMVGFPLFIRRVQAPIIMQMLKPSRKDLILDLGCGEGFFAYEIAKTCRCIGIDLSINRNLTFAVEKRCSAYYMRADASRTPFRDGTFDKILLSSLLQMVEDDRGLIKEAHRLLKREGILILTVPKKYVYLRRLNGRRAQLNEMFGAHKGYYSRDEVIQILKDQNFEVLEMEHSPKRIGSLLYECHLFFQCMNLRLPDKFVFPFIYPVALFDRLDRSDAKGCEIVVKSRAVKK